MELKKGQNMIEHEEEIYSRPARTWFQSGQDKLKAEGSSLAANARLLPRLTTMFVAVSKQSYEAGFDVASAGKQKKPVDDTKASSLFLYMCTSSNTCAQPKRDKFSGLSRKAKRRKMAREDDEELGDSGAMHAAIRSAKKAARPTKIGVPEKRPSKSRSKDRKAGPKKVTARAGGAFERDFGQKGSAGGRREGVRAKRGDTVGGMGKKKGGKPRTKK